MDPSRWDDDDNQDEEGDFQERASSWRDGLFFLIDASKPMFVEDESGICPFKISLECCKTTMVNKIISSEQDMIGVIFFGTSKANNTLNFEHISVVQELERPNVDMIKKFERLLNRNNFDDFENKFGHSDNFSLSDGLWLCQYSFSASKLKLSSQRILLLTNNDNPHAGSQQKQHQARSKASDLGDAGVDIDLLHMGKNFNPTLFYKDLIQQAKGEDADDWTLPNPSTKFEELLVRVCRKDHKKRSMGRIPFFLGEGIEFYVSVYNLVRRTPIPKKVKLDRTTNENVVSSIKKFHGITGEEILPSELIKYQEFALRQIYFRPDELSSMRILETATGVHLLGFKPLSKLKLHQHLKPSSFIYPEEELMQGSRKFFVALMTRCIARKVVPICAFKPRSNSTPSLVALIPQEEKLDDSNLQIVPPGFHVVYLPYSDDIRKLNMEIPMKAEPEQIEKAKQVVKKLRFAYSPYRFENPVLQTHWRNIEALALDYNEPREVTDHTVPDHTYMSNKLGALSQEFLDLVYTDGYVPGGKPKAASGRKRASDSAAEKPVKTVKTTDEDSMKEMAQDGKVNKLKVDELKAFLMGRGVKVTGMKKVELVTKVYEVLDIPQPN